MKRIAIFSGPEGHLSIAQALMDILEPQYDVKLFFDRHSVFKLYTPVYQIFPQANQIPFKLSQYERARNLITQAFRLQYEKKLTEFYQDFQPDLCISTYFMFNPILESFQAIDDTPFVNTITDPKSIHPLIVSSEAAYNLTFDQNSVATIATMNPQARAKAMTWFVRNRFLQSYTREKICLKLNLDPTKLTLLITSGSEGTTMIAKVLPSLLMVDQPVQVVVACGNNTAMQKSIAMLQSVLQRVNDSTQLLALGFVDNMHEYMQAAHLVVGKAGPNTLFESVATETPFMAITHISGQEDGNLDIIRDYNLGYVEENPLGAQKLLQTIINHPEKLDVFTKDIHQLAKKLKAVPDETLKLVKPLLK